MQAVKPGFDVCSGALIAATHNGDNDTAGA